jgi:DNA-binding NtrC family response regulator
LQAKLLRALDTGELSPLGETGEARFEARVVSACQQPLSALVAAGSFREDLAARLSGLVVTLPELSERRGDIPALFEHFLSRHSGGTAPAVATRLYELLCLYHWPGNVRELELVARSLLAVHGLEPTLRASHWAWPTAEPGDAPRSKGERSISARDVETLTRALAEARGNVKRAAELAGFSRQKAYRLIGSRRLAAVVSASRSAVTEHSDGSSR